MLGKTKKSVNIHDKRAQKPYNNDKDFLPKNSFSGYNSNVSRNSRLSNINTINPNRRGPPLIPTYDQEAGYATPSSP